MTVIQNIMKSSSILGIALLGLAAAAPAAYAVEPAAPNANSSDFDNFVKAARAAGASDSEINDYKNYVEHPSSAALGSSTYAGKAHPNGCSDPLPVVDDAVKYQFDGPCNLHDICYSSEENNGRSRKDCDKEFRKNMEKVCYKDHAGDNPNGETALNGCLQNARMYYYAVRWGGKGHFKGSGDPS